MDPATEALPPPTDAAPRDGYALRPAMPADRPTAESLLRAIVAAGGPWFPSAHAKKTGIVRADLDQALTELRNAGLVRVVTWEKGVGQGYVATPDGERVAERITDATPAGPEPVTPALAGVLDFRPPLVTPALIGANVLWFLVGAAFALRWGQTTSAAVWAPWSSVLERVGAVSAPDIAAGQWWRLVTCGFVHVGFWHLVLNMVMLAATGPAAELFWGRWRALLLYLLATLAAATAAVAHHPFEGPADTPVVVAGASGAIWGLMGAVLAWYMLYRPDLPPELAADMGRRLAFAFVLNAGICLLPEVSWEGHLAGGLTGFVGGGLLNAARFNPPRRRLLSVALLVLLPLASVAGLVAAMSFGSEWAALRTKPAPTPAVTFQPPADPKTILDPVRPEVVKPVRWAAVRVWLVAPQFREKHRLIARGEIDTLARRVGAAAEQLAALPETVANGPEAVAARRRELDRLRELVDSPTTPTVEEWQSWGERQREADRFWARPSAPSEQDAGSEPLP